MGEAGPDPIFVRQDPRGVGQPRSLSDLGRPGEEGEIRAEIFMRLRNMVDTNDQNRGKFFAEVPFSAAGRDKSDRLLGEGKPGGGRRGQARRAGDPAVG
jgi:hypothetical protein